MPRARHFPSYPKRPHSSGQARIKINGQPIYLGRHGSPESRAEYRRRMLEWEKGQAPRPRSAGHLKTVAEVLAAYGAHAAKYYAGEDGKPTEQLRRVNLSLAYVRDGWGHRPIDDFDQNALDVVREEMVQAGYFRKTINLYVGCIRRAWKWAAKRKLIPAERYADLLLLEDLQLLRTTAPESIPVKPVPYLRVLRTLRYLLPPIVAMLRLQMRTGMRPGEVLIMRPMDIDQSGDVWVYRPGSDRPYGKHKNAWRGQRRTVLLGPAAQRILAPFLIDRPADAFLFNPREALTMKAAEQRMNRKSKMTPSQTKRDAERAERRARSTRVHDHYDNCSYPKAVLRACKRGGIPPWHPNQIRHSVSTSIRKIHGPDAARAMLGQKSLQAAEIYSELDMDKVADIMRQSG